jgi:hypothetical protein
VGINEREEARGSRPHNDPLDGRWVIIDQRTATVLLGTAVTVEEILEFLDRDNPVSRLS